MPCADKRTRVANVAVKGRMATSGRMHATYRDVRGNTLAATVLGPGSVSGLKLNIDTHGGGTRILDNVPAATGLKQVGRYHIREA